MLAAGAQVRAGLGVSARCSVDQLPAATRLASGRPCRQGGGMATTPEPPYGAVIFTNRRTADDPAGNVARSGLDGAGGAGWWPIQ
jgi:hypothetical protein